MLTANILKSLEGLRDKKNLKEYHDLNVKIYALLLADVFESFHSKCIETYQLDRPYFLLAPELAWQTCLKRLKWNYYY